MTNTCNHAEPCVWSMTEEEGAWDMIHAEWAKTDFEAIRRRDANPECGNFWITGGIFDTITTTPFPGRDK